MSSQNSLSIVAFVGPETLPIHVAVKHGHYAREGLDVRCDTATGSVDQMVRLINGDCQMVMTAIDNVIAYDAGQGGAPVDPLPDIVAFLGCASEPRPLISLPEIASLTDLRGRRIAVDALNTGFSFLLRQMLDDAGLGMADYELVPIGAPPARWQSMEAGACDAALLSKAFGEIAIAAGCQELRADRDPWAAYQGGVFAARQSWIDSHEPDVTGFIRATLAATLWILDPENREHLPDLLTGHLPHMTRNAAQVAADDMGALLSRDLPINSEGLRTVLALRQKYGSPPALLAQAERYLDLSHYRRVLRSH